MVLAESRGPTVMLQRPTKFSLLRSIRPSEFDQKTVMMPSTTPSYATNADQAKAMELPVFLHEWNIAFEMPVDLTSLLAERLQRQDCFLQSLYEHQIILTDNLRLIWFKTISHRRFIINKQLREKRARWQLFNPIPGEFMSMSWLVNDLRTCKISFSWDRRVPKSEAPMKKRKMQKTCPSCDCERHQHTLHHSK